MVRHSHYWQRRPLPSTKFAAFDIDTCPVDVDETTNWRNQNPLGVTCAAVWMTDARRSQVFYGASRNGGVPRPRMSRSEVRRFVQYLADLVGRGYRLLSWNATALDWDVLAAESGQFDTCRRLALSHVDMMFHVVCVRGHRLSLHKAARGMGVADQLSSRDPERLWSLGHFDAVLGYLRHDARVTLELAHKSQDAGWMRWTSRAGRDAYLPLPDGWLTVRDANHLPKPDVSGLDFPTSRRSLTSWMNDEQEQLAC